MGLEQFVKNSHVIANRSNLNKAASYLHDGRGDEEFLCEGPCAHVVAQTNGQVLQDGFDAVTGLLARDP